MAAATRGEAGRVPPPHAAGGGAPSHPRKRRRLVWAAVFAIALSTLALPEPSEPPPYREAHPFAWGQDALWDRLERDFDAARAAGCSARTAQIDTALATLDRQIDALRDAAAAEEALRFADVESQLFAVTADLGACPHRIGELATRLTTIRTVVSDHARGWDPDDRAARDRMYRLLYGARAALEELILQAPDPDAFALIHGAEEASATPSATVQGVRLHSGDILVSRGGAPTSALIARGNDYPGNFSHIALLHVADTGTPRVIEAHIESGVGVFSAERYLQDTKLRIMVLRLRADHPAVREDPVLAHRAASAALRAAERGHIAYDFAMDYRDPSKQFCSEVAWAAYAEQGVWLWRGRSSMSSPGLTRWLASLGVEHFETLSPSDIEYDPQLRVVAEWRDPETLFDDHADNAVLDVLLEGADAGDPLGYDHWRLPLARVAKAYSVLLNLAGLVGPIPEGMSATAGLRVERLGATHARIRAHLDSRIAAYRASHHRRPPYWTLLRMARQARDTAR